MYWYCFCCCYVKDFSDRIKDAMYSIWSGLSIMSVEMKLKKNVPLIIHISMFDEMCALSRDFWHTSEIAKIAKRDAWIHFYLMHGGWVYISMQRLCMIICWLNSLIVSRLVDCLVLIMLCSKISLYWTPLVQRFLSVL